ncbi:uncharacterized protein MKZ38_005162 [Zalerion maritima]|uniref:Uncharacterized protein n=1 Tax=Zalerion maritima TaxID=339359 RepID=A0AAD5RX04_9PEZI|nr:uncharacterized protein MKZ38_005162 [Zalerion maritima]
MRAHLARRVCRRILGRDALILAHSSRCSRPHCLLYSSFCAASSSPLPAPTSSFRTHHPQAPQALQGQRRTFFEFLRKPKREVKVPRFDPGWGEILNFRHHQTSGLRMPANEEILNGYRKMINYRAEKGLPINSMHAFCLNHALKYLVLQEEKLGKKLLDVEDLVQAQNAFHISPGRELSHHLEATELLHHLLCERFRENQEADREEVDVTGFAPTRKEIYEELGRYLRSMAQYGGAVKGAQEFMKYVEENKIYQEYRQTLLNVALGGLAREGKEKELLEMVGAMRKVGCWYNPKAQHTMVVFYAARKDREKTQKWLDMEFGKAGLWMQDTTLAEIMRFVARSDDPADKEWGETILRQVCDSDPPPRIRHIILQWAVLVKNKSAEDVANMIKVMVETMGHKPVSATIRVLVQAAVDKGDPYLAERMFSLFHKFDLVPDPETRLLQVQYRTKAGDMKGAAAAFDFFLGELDPEIVEKIAAEKEEGEEESATDGVNGNGNEIPKTADTRTQFGLSKFNPYLWALPGINEYIRALCESNTNEATQQAIQVAQVLEDRGLPIEPVTAAAMCMNFFARDMSFDVIDVLSIYAGQYSVKERETVYEALIDYICNRNHSTARAWDAYQLLRQFFPEMNKERRVKLMHEFFGRRRGDMAAHVFGHMRQKEGVVRPRSEEYVQVFEGLGKWPDEDALSLIFNMLKLDPLVTYNTQLYNSLMIAWGATESPRRAEIFWEHIQNSIEGPNYNSLEIIFWVYGLLPWGDERANKLWRQLQDLEVDVPERVWVSYVACLAAQGHTQEVIKMCIEGCDGVGELQGESYGIIYNAFPNRDMKADFEAWVLGAVPEQWKGLQKKRKMKNYLGDKFFPSLTREFKA